MSDLPESISVREVGPRDGLQNESPVSTEAKVELVDALSGTGVRRIEAVSFVSPRAIPQMADADEVWQRISRHDDVRYSALVPNLRGAQRALDAGFHEIEVVVSASDTHNRQEPQPLDRAVPRRHRRARHARARPRDDGPGHRLDRVGVPVRG